MPGDRGTSACRRAARRPGRACSELGGLVAEHRLVPRGPAARDDHESAARRTRPGAKPKTRKASWFSTLLTRRKIGRHVGDARGRRATFASSDCGQQRAREVGRALLEDPEVGAADVDQVARRVFARRPRSRAARRSARRRSRRRRRSAPVRTGRRIRFFKTNPAQVTALILWHRLRLAYPQDYGAVPRRDPEGARARHRPGASDGR